MLYINKNFDFLGVIFMKKIFLVSILSVIFSAISIGATFITSSKDNAINIRQAAGTDSKVIETIKNGHILESSEKSGEWYKVTYYDSDIKKTFTGYIHNSQLKEIVGKLVITSSEGYSNIREKPTTKSTIKTRLKTGQTVYAISKTADDWYYIRYNGNEYGYIYSNQVAKK